MLLFYEVSHICFVKCFTIYCYSVVLSTSLSISMYNLLVYYDCARIMYMYTRANWYINRKLNNMSAYVSIYDWFHIIVWFISQMTANRYVSTCDLWFSVVHNLHELWCNFKLLCCICYNTVVHSAVFIHVTSFVTIRWIKFIQLILLNVCIVCSYNI